MMDRTRDVAVWMVNIAVILLGISVIMHQTCGHPHGGHDEQQEVANVEDE